MGKARDNRTVRPFHRIVVKLGTSLLTGDSDHLSEEVMSRLVRQVAQLHQQGLEQVVVSSGDIETVPFVATTPISGDMFRLSACSLFQESVVPSGNTSSSLAAVRLTTGGG